MHRSMTKSSVGGPNVALWDGIGKARGTEPISSTPSIATTRLIIYKPIDFDLNI